jgi:membrane protein
MRHRLWDSIKYYATGLYNYVDEDHCFLLASGIAFNVLYCILPLSLVIFYFFSAALTSQAAINYIFKVLSEGFPLPVYQDALKGWVSKQITAIASNSHIAGLIGGITLVWLAMILFSTLRTSLNAVLNIQTKRSYFWLKLRDLILMVVVLVLLLSSTFHEPVWSIVQRLGERVLPSWLEGLVGTAIPYVVSLGTSILLYVLLFRMLPHERLSRKVVLVSATTTVVLTEAMRQLFLYYMTHISSIGALYGTYAFLVGTSLWVYYASLAFLIGAEVGWLYKERNEVQSVVPPPEVAQFVRDPGARVNDPETLQSFESLKQNPTRAAGEVKPPPPQEH